MSLLDENNESTPNTNVTPQGETIPEGQSNGWFWDENTPGVGERPAYLPDKYKSVADVAKAHKELETRLGTAPKEYDFSKGDSWIEPEYEPFKEMAEYAKSKHVPQDVMDKVLESVGLYLDEFSTDINEEKAKLGENAANRIQTLNNWAKSNLSEKAFLALSAGMRTAEQIEALEEIRNKMLSNTTVVPGNESGTVQGGMTMEEYRSELNANFTKYKTDPAFRKEMERKLENIVNSKK